MKFKTILAAFLAVFALGAYSFIPENNVSAEEAGAIHLQVSPVKQRLSLDPGESYVSSFKVSNIGTEKFSYTTSVTPYRVVDENATPNFSDKSVYTQIADWVTFNDDKQKGVLEPGESVDVPFTITVPKDAPAGGQYAAIMAQTSDGNEAGASVQTTTRVGMILYASVAGETHREGAILDNTVNHFFFEPPISVTSLVENTGNVEITAVYTVKIWPLFGGETVYSNEERPSSLDIMPETKRFSSIEWEGSPSLGAFWVEQTVAMAGVAPSTVKRLVIICPIWLLFLLLAILFFLIFWLISRIVARSKLKKQPAKEEIRKENHEEKH